MTNLQLPIVGGFYRPPALAIQEILASGQRVWLEPEPDNPADSNAIKIVLDTGDLPWQEDGKLSEDFLAAAEEKLSGYGYSIEELVSQEHWHLGYVPRNVAKHLRETGEIVERFPATILVGDSATTIVLTIQK